MAIFTGTGSTDLAIPPLTLTGFTGGTLSELNDSVGDIFDALGGDDVILAGSGSDTITGGAGNDNLVGNGGQDVFVYNASSEIGSDTIDGGGNLNTLRVTFSTAADFRTASIASSGLTSIDRLELTNASGSDVVFNGAQVNSTGVNAGLAVVGSAGTDRLTFASVSGTFSLGLFSFSSWSATDVIVITASASANITGTSQNDSITGSSAADTLIGGNGNDTLNGAFGSDSLDGGAGVDTNNYGFYNDPIHWNMTTGAVTFFTAGGAFNGNETAINLENALMGNGNDSITGNADANRIEGGNGNNTLIGAAGADTLIGGSGADEFTGGADGDSLVGGAGADRFIFASQSDLDFDNIDGGGNIGIADEIRLDASGNYNLSNVTIQSTGGSSIEVLALSGSSHNVTVNAFQFGPSGLSTSLLIQGGGSGASVINIENVAFSFDASGFTFSNWNSSEQDRLIITGTTGEETITGSSAVDYLVGGDGMDVLSGGGGADTLSGGQERDTLVGGAGADTLEGGTESDTFRYSVASDLADDRIDGGADDGGFGGDEIEINFNGGVDLSGVSFLSLSTTSIEGLRLLGEDNTVFVRANQFGTLGLSMALNIEGGTGANQVTIQGVYGSFDASAFVFANWSSVADKLVFNSDDSTDTIITGTSQNDAMNGGNSRADRLVGGNGNDTLVGQGGDDTLDGGQGVDLIYGGLGADSNVGGTGNELFLYYFSSHLTGDTIDGGADDGGYGDALELGFAGTVDLSGVVFQSAGTTSIESLGLYLGGGHDVSFDASQFSTAGLSTALQIQGDNASTDIIRINAVTGSFSAAAFTFSSSYWNDAVDRIVINGGTSADNITGSSQADILTGGQGVDTLTGGNGADVLDGGAGADSLDGGADGDFYYVDNAGDTITELSGGGTGFDYAYSSVSFTQWANVEYVLATGAAALLGTGNADVNAMDATFRFAGASFSGLGGNDVLYGSNYADSLDGGADSDILVGYASVGGIDSLTGGAGDDVYYSFETDDVLTELGGGGLDTVYAYANITLAANIDQVLLVGTGTTATGNAQNNNIFGNNSTLALTLDGLGGDDWLIGSEQADELRGGADNDILQGLAGQNSLTGGAGNDQYFSTSPLDVITELAGGGFDTLYASYGILSLAAEVEQLVLSGTSNFGYGNGLNNAIYLNNNNIGVVADAGGGDDIIYGSMHFDRLIGGLGNDTMVGGVGPDRFVWEVAGNMGADTITDFGDGLDLLAVVGMGYSAGSIGGAITISGGANALVTFASGFLAGTTVTLLGVNQASISAADFAFL